jgi:DNA-binding NtrC family response regulator
MVLPQAVPVSTHRESTRHRVTHDAASLRGVLVVGGDSCLRESLRFLLEGEGCAVSVAADIDEAARLLGEHHFEVMICDLMMVRGGPRWIERVCRTDPALSVVVISGADGQSSVLDALRASVCIVLGKPIPLAELLAAIDRLPISAQRGAA